MFEIGDNFRILLGNYEWPIHVHVINVQEYDGDSLITFKYLVYDQIKYSLLTEDDIVLCIENCNRLN